jgi:hypothetical protein
MKKTVSWSSETLKRNRGTEGDDTSENTNSMIKSKSADASKKQSITSPAVNSRIQQMIAMQKAQNATMRQLLSTGDAGSASPSGLRDLVTTNEFKSIKIDLNHVPEDVKGVVEKEVAQKQQLRQQEIRAIKKEPIKPPSITRGSASTQNGLTSYPADGGISYQGSSKGQGSIPATNASHLLPGAPPTNPFKNSTYYNPCAMYSTPDHLNPKLPRFSSDSSSCDSPVSYNSVLDHNSTPATVKERKRQQLQTIQSQEQMMAENYDVEEFKIEPTPLSLQNPIKEFNWESIVALESHDYVLPVRSVSGEYGYGATVNNDAEYNVNKALSTERSGSHTASNYSSNQQRESFGTELEGLLTHNATAKITQDNAPPSKEPRSEINESHTQHLFHYGGRNSGGGPPSSVDVHSQFDYHSAYHGDDIQDMFHIPHIHRHRRSRRRAILWNILCSPCKCIHSNEQLSRSFCFGAIDGMLTGAGILAACIGLGLLPHRAQVINSLLSTEESMHTEWILIALTLAACVSDGVCMAIGHIWSTRLVAGSTYEERKEELRNFETCRSDAKARLVDLLLSKGMLKIDAMSLADTLEGYPDMFVSTLLGEALGNSNVCGMSGLGSGGGGSRGMVRVPSGGASTASQKKVIPQYNAMNNEWDIPPPAYGPSELHYGLKYESYSDVSDFQQDPDLKAFTDTMSDGRLEALFMMLSFGSFSVIPILIHSFLPYVVDFVTSSRDENNVLIHDHPPENTTLVMISLGANTVIMFFLGAWKRYVQIKFIHVTFLTAISY